jgi:hypothetical protein
LQYATSWSTEMDSARAVDAAYRSLEDGLGGAPQLLILSTTQSHDAQVVTDYLSASAPNAKLIGGTSRWGVMTAEGYHSRDRAALGMCGVRATGLVCGIASVDIQDDPKAAAIKAVDLALQDADRPGELPDLVAMIQAPGHEELVIEGIQEVLGPEIAVIGGSAADDGSTGQWKQYANGRATTNGLTLAVLFLSTKVGYAFRSGYAPTEHRAVVTRASGRTIYELDGRPAAEVYDEWTDGLLSRVIRDGVDISTHSDMYPMGRAVRQVSGVTQYALVAPFKTTPDGAIHTFAAARERQVLTLMTGTQDSLVRRAGKVISAAMESGSLEHADVRGAVVIYCAGCMAAVADRMDEVVDDINTSLDGKPFIGTFTSGEQGCFLEGGATHANCMISALVF